MGWHHYRGKQTKAPVGCNFLDSENEGEKWSYNFWAAYIILPCMLWEKFFFLGVWGCGPKELCGSAPGDKQWQVGFE